MRSTTLWVKKCLATKRGRGLAVVQTVMVRSWLPIAITLYGSESFPSDFADPLAQPTDAVFMPGEWERLFLNIEWLNLATIIGALCPKKSNVADHSPLSRTGAECLGFWKPWVVVIKWPQGDQSSRLKKVEPSWKHKNSNRSRLRQVEDYNIYKSVCVCVPLSFVNLQI